jgi:hypothetical protein
VIGMCASLNDQPCKKVIRFPYLQLQYQCHE